jgi:outer membrane protein assembly factor BamE (lipoprotein component of BamABCDE complex)
MPFVLRWSMGALGAQPGLQKMRKGTASLSRRRTVWPGRLAATVAALLCTSCIVVPVGVFTKPPYGPEVLQKLSAPGADRERVRQVLGNPALVRAKGAYWYYSNSRATWGIIGGTSSAVLTDDEWLAVRFDKAGKVVFVEKNDLSRCLSNGMCFDGTAPHDDDSFAKSYQPKADECAVYLLLDRLPWPLTTGTVKFFVDGVPIGSVNSKTYLFLTHAPGTVDIAAYDLKIGTRCIGGAKLYVRAVKKMDTSWLTGEDLAPLSLAEGEAAIGVRRAALPD